MKVYERLSESNIFFPLPLSNTVESQVELLRAVDKPLARTLKFITKALITRINIIADALFNIHPSIIHTRTDEGRPAPPAAYVRVFTRSVVRLSYPNIRFVAFTE
ncbi:hypothetical protein EVAR_67892_1 [Eumeta japonica]|uniref:Uncharacterized protein n=1 Tax=Eumeta variegata TaxID=151549 RepID=A0A4C1YXT0_EUMVA|nr:hypothetical protein EVAR_67892_1 [Eumeta japonica]